MPKNREAGPRTSQGSGAVNSFRGGFRAGATIFGLMLVLCLSVLFANAQTLPNNAQPSAGDNCNVSSSAFKSFFQGGIASVNGVVNPANSVTFTNNTALHNCDFYQWAQQMFLWLTSPAPATYGGGGGRIFSSPAFYTVSPADASGKRTLIPNQAGFGVIVPFPIHLVNVRAAQVGVHGLPVIMSKSGQMFEVQPGPVSKAGKPLVLNQAGQQVEVSGTALKNGKLVLLDNTGKPISKPKLIVPKQFTPELLQNLRPQQQRLAEPVPAHEELMQPTAAHVVQLQKLQPRPVNPSLIAQQFVLNGKNIFLNVNGGVIETEEGQAGDDGVLVAQNGSLIYYVTMVNDVMAYFLTGTKDGGITPTPTQFPTTAGALAQITTFATAHGRTPSPISDPTCATAIGAATSPFPDPCALAIEVKSSWIETTGLANLNEYITTEAVIPTFDQSNPNKWTPNGQKTTTLALVGMHVVGSANGHPEMIWSSFQHFGNAPLATFKYNASSGTNPHTVTQANPVTGTWLFCATGATGNFNQMHAQFDSPNIVGVGGPIGPSNVLSSTPFGAVLGTQPNPLIASDAESNTQIIAIDNSIQQDFAALSGGPDIRTNYFMTGATWTEGGATPAGNFPPGNAVGTSQMENPTMETFQQTSTFNEFSNNCLTCHGTNQLSVSHVACDPIFGCTAGIQPLF